MRCLWPEVIPASSIDTVITDAPRGDDRIHTRDHKSNKVILDTTRAKVGNTVFLCVDEDDGDDEKREAEAEESKNGEGTPESEAGDRSGHESKGDERGEESEDEEAADEVAGDGK